MKIYNVVWWFGLLWAVVPIVGIIKLEELSPMWIMAMMGAFFTLHLWNKSDIMQLEEKVHMLEEMIRVKEALKLK